MMGAELALHAGTVPRAPRVPGHYVRPRGSRTVSALVSQYIRIDVLRAGAHVRPMAAKTSQLQIRVSPEQKALLKEAAGRSGISVSAYVLRRALPARPDELAPIADRVADHRRRPRALAELILRLSAVPEGDFEAAAESVDPAGHTAVVQNCLAAAVEHVSRARGAELPRWVAKVQPLSRPHFAWELRSLRPYQMRAALPSFKRRGLYIPAPPGVVGAGEPTTSRIEP